MSGTAVSRFRTFPFMEHRTLREVYECQALALIYRIRSRRLTQPEAQRLQVLQGRAVEPDRDPPPAVA